MGAIILNNFAAISFLQCQATIAPLYNEETVYSLRRGVSEPVHSDDTPETTTSEPIANYMPKRDADSYEVIAGCCNILKHLVIFFY